MSFIELSTKILAKRGKKTQEEVFQMSEKPQDIQNELLFRILNEAKDTEFGTKYNFKDIKTITDYQNQVPILEYDDYAAYIDRMVKGEKNVLTTKPIAHVNLTSGTLGVPKMIPVTEDHIRFFSKYNAKYLNFLVSDAVGTKWMKYKGLSLTEGSYRLLPTKVSIGCASSIMAARIGKLMPFFKMDMCKYMYTSPIEARQPKEGTPTRYLHARFALMDKNISYSNATFSSYLLEIMRYIEDHSKELIDDIRYGKINKNIELPNDVYKTLIKKIKPMPQRADELQKIFDDGFNVATPIAKRLWPNLSYIICVGGASFSQYVDKLKERYVGYDIPFLFLGIMASEGFFSLPIKMNDTSSMLVPDCVFMEFLPVEEENPKPLLMNELELNKEYELVITTVNGLYRYRMKDVVRVTGFLNKTPMVEFVSRKGNAINMFGEKTSDKALMVTAMETCKEHHLDMYDYAFYPNSDDGLGHYTLLLEVRNDSLPNVKEVAKTANDKLALANEDYGEVAKDNICAPMDVKFLQRETFLLYKDLMIFRGRSAAQFKPIHVLTPVNKKFFFGLAEE